MKKLDSTLPNMVMSLVGICVVVSAILAYLNNVTAAPIKEAQVQAKIAAIKQVTPAFDNNPYEEAYKVAVAEGDSLLVYPAKKGGAIVGYAIETNTKNGFNGLIEVMMGLDAAGKMVDYSVLTMSETPGLGTKIPEWFHSKSKNAGNIQDMRGVDLAQEAPLKVSKDGGKVDAITAATISSRAFLESINRGYEAYKVANANKQ
ncbi:MAG: RnfABCDGE type electron transport complex subunit G [Porphyromonas sp.]|nr:RnfABCDGE type electron transport complex subunit G [Porphyromonas sp.]